MLCTLGLAPQARAQDRSASSLSWLAGCWVMPTRSGVIEEQWTVPRGGTLLGMGRTTRGDSTVSFEFMRIHRVGDSLVFSANTSDGRADFPARTVGDSVVFEDLAHDFPQRVIYRRAGPDSLAARIEGMRGGQLRGINFGYRRAPCR